MNNEPVAWIDEETGCFVYSQYDYEDLDEHGKDGLIPLYTHPPAQQWTIEAKFKELTDEEIKEAMEFAGIRPSKEWGLATTGNVQLQIFAKAILRKAQEK